MTVQDQSARTEERAPRMMARALTRKLQAQGFTDAQLAVLAHEILHSVASRPLTA